MGVPIRQGLRISSYMLKNKIKKIDKFPLIVELEPLFACNLKCNGCGKIQQTTTCCASGCRSSGP